MPVNTEKPAGKLRKLNPSSDAERSAQVGSGMNFPIPKLIELLEPAQWEEFTEEWASSLKPYKEVECWAGAGDMGRDIVAFTTDKNLLGHGTTISASATLSNSLQTMFGSSSGRSSITPSWASSRRPQITTSPHRRAWGSSLSGYWPFRSDSIA